MILSDTSILSRLHEEDEDRRLEITPFDERLLQPASVDLRLGVEFLTTLPGASNPIINPVGTFVDETIHYERVICDRSKPEFYLFPDQFVIGATFECVKMPLDLIGMLGGKSSLGRVGLLVNTNANYVAPGFEGQLTLEMMNLTNRPIKLVPGMPVAQIIFEQLDSPSGRPYGTQGLGSHYQGQQGPQPADFSRERTADADASESEGQTK